MMTYAVDAVLLLALLITSLRVGAMYRELKRLRGYQSQYVEVFGETSRAAGHIGDAVRQLGREGRDVLEHLETLIGEARVLSDRLEAAGRPWNEAAPRVAESDDVGTYPSKVAGGTVDPEAETLRYKHEILKFAGDTRRLQEGRGEDSGDAPSSLQPRPARGFRLAPSVRTLRAAGGNG
jgi:hypothetical protein